MSVAARRSIEDAASAVAALAARCDAVTAAVRLVIHPARRLACVGVGKSGIIARKLAATFSATGQPAYFMHATDALHGDIGQVCDGDAALIVSHSGETPEILEILRHLSVPIIAICGARSSSLGRRADAYLDAQAVDRLPHVPMASTLAAMAMGDAFAAALMEARGLDLECLRRLHPGGTIGREAA